MPNSLHHLIIGGSGMLAEVCLALAAAGKTVSVIARNTGKLQRLSERAASSSGKIVPLSVDYSNSNALSEAITTAVAEHGRISSAVCWIHSHSPQARRVVADLIGNESAPPHFFDILGSAAANPQHVDERDIIQLRQRRDIQYHCIILGFIITPSGSRWLTNEEICTGVLQALNSPRNEAIIGVVEPWDLKP